MEEVYIVKLKNLPPPSLTSQLFANHHSSPPSDPHHHHHPHSNHDVLPEKPGNSSLFYFEKDLTAEAIRGFALMHIFMGLTVLSLSVTNLCFHDNPLALDPPLGISVYISLAFIVLGLWCWLAAHKRRCDLSRSVLYMKLLFAIVITVLSMTLTFIILYFLDLHGPIANHLIGLNILLAILGELILLVLTLFTTARVLWPGCLAFCARDWPMQSKFRRKVIVKTNVIADGVNQPDQSLIQSVGPNCVISLNMPPAPTTMEQVQVDDIDIPPNHHGYHHQQQHAHSASSSTASLSSSSPLSSPSLSRNGLMMANGSSPSSSASSASTTPMDYFNHPTRHPYSSLHNLAGSAVPSPHPPLLPVVPNHLHQIGSSSSYSTLTKMGKVGGGNVERPKIATISTHSLFGQGVKQGYCTTPPPPPSLQQQQSHLSSSTTTLTTFPTLGRSSKQSSSGVGRGFGNLNRLLYTRRLSAPFKGVGGKEGKQAAAPPDNVEVDEEIDPYDTDEFDYCSSTDEGDGDDHLEQAEQAEETLGSCPSAVDMRHFALKAVNGKMNNSQQSSKNGVGVHTIGHVQLEIHKANKSHQEEVEEPEKTCSPLASESGRGSSQAHHSDDCSDMEQELVKNCLNGGSDGGSWSHSEEDSVDLPLEVEGEEHHASGVDSGRESQADSPRNHVVTITNHHHISAHVEKVGVVDDSPKQQLSSSTSSLPNPTIVKPIITQSSNPTTSTSKYKSSIRIESTPSPTLNTPTSSSTTATLSPSSEPPLPLSPPPNDEELTTFQGRTEAKDVPTNDSPKAAPSSTVKLVARTIERNLVKAKQLELQNASKFGSSNYEKPVQVAKPLQTKIRFLNTTKSTPSIITTSTTKQQSAKRTISEGKPVVGVPSDQGKPAVVNKLASHPYLCRMRATNSATAAAAASVSSSSADGYAERRHTKTLTKSSTSLESSTSSSSSSSSGSISEYHDAESSYSIPDIERV